MERSTFLKSLAGVGASTLGLSTLSSFSSYDFDLGKIEEFPEHLNEGSLDWDKVRLDFPRQKNEIYLDNASTHPTNIYTAWAVHRITEWTKDDVGVPWWPLWAKSRDEGKNLFAELINADPSEIAHARSRVTDESNMLNGMYLKV